MGSDWPFRYSLVSTVGRVSGGGSYIGPCLGYGVIGAVLSKLVPEGLARVCMGGVCGWGAVSGRLTGARRGNHVPYGQEGE